ncbi:hypothetical protein OC834_007289 [Tilletia horrida]|nr:hypothetical protein OC834_007289 [Tilletia horrida]
MSQQNEKAQICHEVENLRKAILAAEQIMDQQAEQAHATEQEGNPTLMMGAAAPSPNNSSALPTTPEKDQEKNNMFAESSDKRQHIDSANERDTTGSAAPLPSEAQPPTGSAPAPAGFAAPLPSESRSISTTGPRRAKIVTFTHPQPASSTNYSPRFDFVRKSGETIQGEALMVQDRPCRDVSGIDTKDFCRQCADRQAHTDEQLAKAVKEGREFECWWEGVRALKARQGQKRKQPGTHQAVFPSTDRVVVDAYLHERIDADGDVCGKLLRLQGWPRTEDTAALTARCAYTLGSELTPILQTKLNHASNRKVQPLLRSGGVEAMQRCTQCAVYVCGSWQCVKCGAELCLSCFRQVSQMDDVTLSSFANADHVISCQRAQGELFYAHKPDDFVPVARMTVAQLSLHRAMARAVTQAYARPVQNCPDKMTAKFDEWESAPVCRKVRNVFRSERIWTRLRSQDWDR